MIVIFDYISEMRISTFLGLSACFVFMMGWNVFLAQRDKKMIDAYNQVCSELPQPHPDCRYSK